MPFWIFPIQHLQPLSKEKNKISSEPCLNFTRIVRAIKICPTSYISNQTHKTQTCKIGFSIWTVFESYEVCVSLISMLILGWARCPVGDMCDARYVFLLIKHCYSEVTSVGGKNTHSISEPIYCRCTRKLLCITCLYIGVSVYMLN